ncbi:TRAP transporter large permease subunit [Chloroflexota bacterium]
MSKEVLTLVMLGGLLLGVLSGYYLAVPIALVSLLVGYLLFGDAVGTIVYERLYAIYYNYILAAIPLFIFMGIMLEKAGIAEKLYDALFLVLGGLRGGLALTTVVVGTVLAACVGVIGASVTMLATMSLPSMMKRGYDKSLSAGSVCAGGSLGVLIPPSTYLILYGSVSYLSVGKLFMGAFVPGFLLCGLYCTYIAVRCVLQPMVGPAIPREERASVPTLAKLKLFFTTLLPVAVLIMSVLGVIFLGIAPPTEAAAVGASVATLLAVAYRKLTWRVFRETAMTTMRMTSMILLIGGASYIFTGVFIRGGAGNVVESFVLAAPFGRWGAFAVSMFIVFMLGFFIDPIGIIFIITPLLVPLAPALGFNEIWFAIMIIVNLQMALMTPPFAVSIFYLRGAADPSLGVDTAAIIRGVAPFVVLVALSLVILTIFPVLITWLPDMMIR